jgi:Tfp pilus assembly protein PilO
MIKGDLKNQVKQCAVVQWALAGGTLLLCGAVALASIRPTAGQLGDLQRYAAAQRAQLAADRQRAANLAPLQLQTAQLQQQMKAFDQRLGRTSDLPQFIQNVSEIARKASVRNLTWRSDAQQNEADRLAELPIQFSFQSDYTGVNEFLRRVGELPRLTDVRKISVKALPGADGSAGWVNVQLTMNVYFGEE